jgi:3-dehydroshikimate dehydratase
MLSPGLVSITFRQLSPQAVVDLVARAGLVGIEWGGDLHVPHGDLQRAGEVRRLTADAGLAVAAYGSYYRVGHAESGPFEVVLETAVTLGAPLIRVWAGRKGTDSAGAAYFNQVVEDSQRIASLAAEAAIPIVYEFHRETLTDTNAAARTLLKAVDHPNIRSYWQPPRGLSVEENLAGLDAVLPWLVGLHVFNWHGVTHERLPLADGRGEWLRYFEKAESSGRDLYALIEFVRGDAPEQFLADAAALQSWLTEDTTTRRRK